MRYLCLLFLFVTAVAQAQPTLPEATYLSRYAHPQISSLQATFGVGFTGFSGTTTKLGDVDEQGHFLRPYLSLGLGYQYTNYISFIFRTNYLRFKSETAGSAAAIPGFSAHNVDGFLGIKHSFFPQREFDEYLRRWNFYALVGAGAIYYNPKHLDTGVALNEGQETSELALIVPLGIGAEYRLSNFFNMAAELNYRFTGTGYLDGVPNTDEGVQDKNDRYVTLGVNITYRIPRSRYHYKEFLRLKNRPSRPGDN